MGSSSLRRLQTVAAAAAGVALTSTLMVSGAAGSSPAPRSKAGPAKVQAVTAQPDAVLSVFTAPVSVLVNKSLKPRRHLTVSLAGADLPSIASSIEATLTLTAGSRAAHLSVAGSGVYAAAHQTVSNTLILALPVSGWAGGLRLTAVGGSAHVSMLVDGYNAPSPETSALQAEVAALKSQLATVQGQVSSLQNAVSTLSGTLKGVTRTTVGGYDTLQLSGMNVQLLNGSGSESHVNGLGNLIVGYADDTSSYARTGSHNVVTGDDNGWTSYGGLIAGQFNRVAGGNSSVAGDDNQANGRASTVSGGQTNLVSGDYSAVSGGANGSVTGTDASLSGGIGNSASGLFSSITGGSQNVASGLSSWVGGGLGSVVTADCQGVPAVPTTGC